MAYTFKHGDRPLDDFTIQRAVGRGGFGEVYYAVSDGGREVALKYLRNNPQVELRGVAHCMNLKSPHLVTIFDVKKNAADEYFIVMEYVSGPSLRDLLVAEPNGLGPQKAAFFMREIAKGLGYLHDRGIVHRDLKPGNIFYDEGYVKIGDYGLSKAISVSRHSAQTASVGTVHYMAPEVGSGNYHRGIDIYAMGVMLYEMLLGKVPFEGSTMGEVLMKHLTTQPEVDNLPAPFGNIIRKALEKDPQQRYQNVYEMVDDLLAVEDVQASLAGFNPVSLSQAVRQPGDAFAYRTPSPAHSPNPTPRGVPQPRRVPADPLDARELPGKLAKRLADRSAKVDKRMRKLDSKYGRPNRPEDDVPITPAKMQPHPFDRPRGGLFSRIVLAGVVLVVAGLAVGVVNGWEEVRTVSAVMSVVGVTLGITVGCRFMQLLTKSHPQPKWVRRLCLGAPVAAFAGIGVAPLGDRINGDYVLAAWCAIVVASVLCNWREVVRWGSSGDLSFKPALKTGMIAFILTVVLGRSADKVGFFAGSVVFAGTMAVQAFAWLFPLLEWLDGPQRGRDDGAPPPHAAGVPAPLNPRPTGAARAARDLPIYEAETMVSPAGSWSRRAGTSAPAPAEPPARRLSGGEPASFLIRDDANVRSMPLRVLGGFFGFACLIGCLVLVARGVGVHARTLLPEADALNLPPMMRAPAHLRSMAVAQAAGGAAALFGLMVLGFRKASAYRRGGFLRDTVRPALAACVFGLLVFLCAAEILPVHGGPPPDMRRLLIAIFGAAWLILLAMAGRRRRAAARIDRNQLEPTAEERGVEATEAAR